MPGVDHAIAGTDAAPKALRMVFKVGQTERRQVGRGQHQMPAELENPIDLPQHVQRIGGQKYSSSSQHSTVSKEASA